MWQIVRELSIISLYWLMKTIGEIALVQSFLYREQMSLDAICLLQVIRYYFDHYFVHDEAATIIKHIQSAIYS